MQRIIWTSLAVVLALTGIAHAESIVVFDFKAPASYEHDAITMSRLLRMEVEKIVGPELRELPGKNCFTRGCARQVLVVENIDAAVVGDLTSLGGELLLIVDVVRETEVITYDIQLASTSEFRKLAPRLAKAIVKGESWESARGVDTVAREEEYPFTTRVHGMWKFGLSVGLVVPQSNSYLGADYLTTITGRVRYEIRQVGIEAELGYYYSNNLDADLYLTEIPVEIMAHYYLRNADFSPFIGGGAGAHAVYLTPSRDTQDTDISYWMFTVNAYLGAELLRTYTFQINGRIGYRYGFIDFDEAVDDNNDAHGIYGQVGFTFP